MRQVRAAVLCGYGLNCDWETAHALALAGAKPERVHISDLTGAPGYEPTTTLEGFDILVLVGGFSWGDDHGAGVLLAGRLRHHLRGQLEAFLKRGGLVIGICNGFQALVNLGLLPMLEGRWQRRVALMANDCGNFQDRWVRLVVEEGSRCVFTRGLSRLELPIRHGEGKFYTDPDTLARIESEGLVVLRYADENWEPAGGRWPANPNGSLNDIAGICDPTGRVLGLMPHPEAFWRASNHPHWTAHAAAAAAEGRPYDPYGPGPGLEIFRNAVADIAGRGE